MIFSFLKKASVGTVKTVANVPAWFSYRFMRSNTEGVYDFVRPFYKKPDLEGKQRSTFQEVVDQYHLSDEDLALRLRNLYWQSILFGGLTILSFAYMLYLFSGAHILAGFIAFTITGLLFLRWCTSRFWVFQIREKKLGCSIQEWLYSKKR